MSRQSSHLRLGEVPNAGRHPPGHAEQRGQSPDLLSVHDDDGRDGEIFKNSRTQVVTYHHLLQDFKIDLNQVPPS